MTFTFLAIKVLWEYFLVIKFNTVFHYRFLLHDLSATINKTLVDWYWYVCVQEPCQILSELKLSLLSLEEWNPRTMKKLIEIIKSNVWLILSVPYSKHLCSNHLEIENFSDFFKIKIFSSSDICQLWIGYSIQIEPNSNVVLSRNNVFPYFVTTKVNCSF